MDSLVSFLIQRGANEAFIKDKDKLWYLSNKELLNPNTTDLMACLTKGVKIDFRNWNKRIRLNNSITTTNLEKFIKFIEDAGQSACEMSQESIDYLKSLFQMDFHYKLRVSDHKEVEVFCSFNDSQRKRLWRREVVQIFKNFIEKGLNVPVPVVVVSASLLLIALSLYDLYQIYVDCEIIEKMIEKDKREYVEHLTIMEKIIAQILIALENQSDETFNSLLPILATNTTKIIEKINKTYNMIRSDINDLSSEVQGHRNIETASALSSLVSIGATIWNWDNLNKKQRTAGLLLGGATAISAISSHMSANRLQKTQEALKQVLTDLENLNEQLKPISFAAKKYYGENIEYSYLHDQFDAYRKSIEEFREIFMSNNGNINLITF